MKLIIIAAVAKNGTIGNNGRLPWVLPSDLKRFKRITLGHTIICGRKTYESIGKPLPGRTTAIISRNTNYQVEGCKTYQTLEAALWQHAQEDIVFCIGGAELYREALDFASKLDITRVLADVEGDTFFPEIDGWVLDSKEDAAKATSDEFHFQFEKYIRGEGYNGPNMAK